MPQLLIKKDWEKCRACGNPLEVILGPNYRERVLLDMARQLDGQADAYNRYIVEVVGIPLTSDAIVAYGIRQAARYVRGQASDRA